MKKILSLFIIPFVSLFFVTEVKAETYTIDFEVNNVNYSLETNINFINSQKDKISKLYEGLYSKYLNEYRDIYPYYLIGYNGISCVSESCFTSYSDSYLTIVMHLFNQIPSFSIGDSHSLATFSPPSLSISYKYDFRTSGFVIPLEVYTYPYNLSFSSYTSYFYSNFDAKLNFSDYSLLELSLNGDSNSILSLNNGDIFPTMHDYFNLNVLSDPNSSGTTYVEVDLNKYSYIALSLKNYDVKEFDSTFYIKGQLCPTVVYNYGLEERLNTDRCNIPFDNFSPIRYRISNNDIKNHFIYYFKAYDTSIENKVKIDSSIFNIHYITESEKDNPILDINGHKYSSIPYDDLSSTANKNEAENFVPGASEQLTFEGFFDNPLESLKSVWGAIISVFALITEFIVLLPPTMQGFLYISFGIAIALGLIKILL